MSDCIICGAKTIKKDYVSRNNQILHLNKCINCGHLFQDIEKYRDIYSSGEFTEIARNNELSAEKVNGLDSAAFKRFSYYKPFIKKGSKAIEIGSSIGSFVHLLRLFGVDAEGLEPDSIYHAYSKQQYGFTQNNCLLEDYEADCKFDHIYSFHVIEHVEDPKLFIRKIISLLNEDGKLILECPSLEIHEFGDTKQMVWEPHIHYFNSSSIYKLLSPYFKTIKISYRGSGLSVIAEGVKNGGCSNTKFAHYKLRQRIVSGFVKLIPKLKKNSKINSVRNLVIQFILERKLLGFRIRRGFAIIIYKIKEKKYLKKEKGKNGKQITHITNYKGWGNNAGDIVLSNCVRTTVRSDINSSFDIHSVSGNVGEDLIQNINKSNALLIGGGGLFLPDTNKNSISGWQWAVSKEQLEKIETKVLLYAVGYNYFPGQKPNDLFVESLNHIVQKADFVGIRNKGSIKAIGDLLFDKSLVGKIKYQPCPTTVIRKDFENISPKKRTRNVAINIAFDRYERRFGEGIYEKLYQIAKAIKKIEGDSFTIYNACHLTIDEKAELIFDNLDIKYKTVRLQHMFPNEVYEFYNKMEVVIGMRGHAQMIPFGLNTKIITLGTHKKMRWFLEDINMTDLFVDIDGSKDITSEIIEKFNYLIDNHDQAFERLILEQDKLYKVTKSNLQEIKSIISD